MYLDWSERYCEVARIWCESSRHCAVEPASDGVMAREGVTTPASGVDWFS